MRIFNQFLYVFGICALSSHCPAGSIFDDDWTPPPPVKPARPSADSHPRLPVPSKAAQERARALLKEAFAGELKDATPKGRRALAEKLIEKAGKATAVPTDEFVLLAGAIQSAKLGSELSLCVQAADMMGAAFDVDPSRIKVDAALAMSLTTAPTATNVQNCECALELTDELAAANDNERAIKLLTALQPVAVSDASLRDQVQHRLKDLQAAEEAAKNLQTALAALKSVPNDPAANLAAGEILCFNQDNWGEGLPLLGRGNDAEISSLATRDLANPSGALEMMNLGNDWWDAAAIREGIIKSGMRRRGYHWMSGALPQLTGLRKAAVVKRMTEAPFLGAKVGKFAEIKTNHGTVVQVAFCPNGYSALISSDDHTISLWNLLTGQEVRQFVGHGGVPLRLGVADTGKIFISSGSTDQTIRLWDMDSGKELHRYDMGSYCVPAVVSPDDAKSLFAANLNGPYVGSTSTFKDKQVDRGEGIYAAAWSSSGRFFATGGWNHVIHVYDAETVKEIAAIQQPDQIYSLALTPDDRKVLAGDTGGHLRVFDIQSRKLLHEFNAAGCRTIVVTPDSRFALAPSGEPNMFFWDLTTGKPSDRFVGEQTAVTSVALSRDGSFALSGDKDGSIRVWKVRTTP